MTLRLVAPDEPWLSKQRPWVRLLAEAADNLGGRLEMEEQFAYLGRYHPPSGQYRPLFGSALGLNPEAAAMLSADKDYTARLLRQTGIPTPRGRVIFSPKYVTPMSLKNRRVAAALPGASEALAFAGEVGFPVIIKPNSGSEGRGVHRSLDPGELEQDIGSLMESEDRLRVEEVVSGRDLRILVLDHAVHIAYERHPLSVTGDGRTPLGQLIARRLDDIAAHHRGSKLSPHDTRIRRALNTQGMIASSVPENGRMVKLLESANLSTGGVLTDLTESLAQPFHDLAIAAVQTLGLRVAGVDILAPNLPHSTSGAHVLEVNAAPGLDYYASHGAPQWARARAFLSEALAAT